jgi:hypothetical protein
MADAIVGLCKDPNGAQDMARAACDKLRERYGWSAVTTPLCALYEREFIS